MPRNSLRGSTAACALLMAAFIPTEAFSSSHMDAPLITLDDPANTTDVYAFVSEGEDGTRYLTTALAVYPFEEPGIGPNTYRFDDDVRYAIHVALDGDADQSRPTISYRFDFETAFASQGTTLQAFLGPIRRGPDCTAPPDQAFDPNQNLRQSYTVTALDHRTGNPLVLGTGVVPPNNQGLVTRFYNRRNNGERPAKGGVRTRRALDRYTQNAICELSRDYEVFAGQRDDGFYADIQSIFDLDFTFSGPNKPFDSQGGYNVHTIVLNIPLDELDGAEFAGVYATTERRRTTELSRSFERTDDRQRGAFVQVARQGNPLFNEALVALEDKDLYNRTSPDDDRRLFAQYALQPELATVLGLPDQDRQDLAGIFAPDLIRVDLTTPPAALAGERDFHRLGVFGGDVLVNADGEQVPGGFPNGRRFGDDVLDIALIALGVPASPDVDVDGVTANDITYNRVFPYAATPLNGRNHDHHGS